MFKKIISLLLTLFLVLTNFSNWSFAKDSFSLKNIFKNIEVSAEGTKLSGTGLYYVTYYKDGEKKAKIVSFVGSGDVVVPDEIEGCPVEEIEERAFAECSYIETITLPDTIKYIGDSAFYFCTMLRSINIPNNIEYLGSSLFSRVASLKTIKIPANITEIPAGTFYDCVNLESITFEGKISKIGSSAFYNCHSLKTIALSNKLTSIGNFAFYNCYKLDNITLPNTVKSIGESAFYKCQNMKNISIPTSKELTTLNKNMFYGCHSLTEIVVPDNIKAIGERAFYDCISLKNIKLSDTITDIGEYAFCNCINVENITLPKQISSIKEKTFAGCKKLISITIPKTVKTIEKQAFYNCENLTNINKALGYAVFLEGLTSIGESTFENCISLNNVVLPNSLESLSRCSFYGCTYLTTINIPSKVKIIPEYAFANCRNLADITISNNVFDISRYAFSECKNLTIHSYPDSYAKKFAKDNGFKFVELAYSVADSDIKISTISNQTYTGKSITPSIEITHGKIKLVKGVDYTLKYENNIEVGTAKITIQGIGKYSKSKTITFKIVPPKISGLIQLSNTTKSIKISWEPEINAMAYNVYRATSKSGTYSKIATVSSNYCIDSDLTSGKIYYYKIKSYKIVNSKYYYSNYSSILTASTKCDNPVITDLSASGDSVKVTWDKVFGASGYQIYRATSKNGTYKRIKTIDNSSTLSYTSTGLSEEATYYYKIRAYKNVNSRKIYSSYSAIKSVKTNLCMYYASGNKIYQVDTKTKKKRLIHTVYEEYRFLHDSMVVHKGWIYCTLETYPGSDNTWPYVYKVRTNGEDGQVLATGCYPVIYNDYIYYLRVDFEPYDVYYDYYYPSDYKGIYRMTLSGNSKKCIKSGFDLLVPPTIYKSKIYFIQYNRDGDQMLKSMNLDGSNRKTLFTSKTNYVDNIVAYSNYLYFNYGDHIYRQKIGSTTKKKILSNATLQNIDNGYLYYTKLNSSNKSYLYKTKTSDFSYKKLVYSDKDVYRIYSIKKDYLILHYFTNENGYLYLCKTNGKDGLKLTSIFVV